MSKRKMSFGLENRVETFQSIADAIHRVTRLPVSIWTPDPHKTTLRIVASVGLPKAYIDGAVLSLDEPSVTGDAYKTGRIQRVKNISTESRWRLKEQAKEMNWKSAVCVPIKEDDIPVGVVSAYAYTDRDISELVHILPDFARLLGLTLESGKHEEIRRHLLEIGLKLQAVTDKPIEVLNKIVQGACELIRASSAVVYPFDAVLGEFQDATQVAAYGLKGEVNIPDKPRAQGGMAAQVLQLGEVVVADIEKECPPGYVKSDFIQAQGIRAFMGIALREAKHALGVLYVNFDVPHEFTVQEKEIIKLFAHQAFNALNHAKLYQQARTQISALEDLHEVGAELTSFQGAPENLSKFLGHIAEVAQRVLNADLIDLYQYEQSGDKYELPPVRIGELFDRNVTKNAIHKDDVICKIVKNREARYYSDSENNNTLTSAHTVKRADAPPKRFVEREKIKSTAAIPLIIGAEVVGVLFANYRIHQIFPPEQKKLAELFAHQAATAIWNARLLKSLQKRLSERLSDIGALQQIYERMYSAKEEELMSLIAETTTKLTGAKYGVVWLADKNGKHLSCVGVAGDDRPARTLPQLPLDENSINGWVMYKGEPYVCNDVRKDEHYQDWYHDSRSELAVPLLYKGKPIGTLDVESTEVGNFTLDHIELLKTLATQAAIAIQNAKILKKLDTLDDAGRALTASIHMKEDEILGLLYQEASGLMDTDNMYIALYDERTDIVRFGLAYVGGEQIDIKNDPKWQPRKAGQGRTEEIIRTRQPIFLPTRAESAAWYDAKLGRQEYLGDPLSSWIGVPMVVGNKVFGVIATYHPKKEYIYSGEDLAILGSLANQAAIALDNAHMHHVTNKKLATLIEIGKEITSSIQLGEESIVDLLYREASGLMDTDNMYIALYDERTDIVRFGLAYVGGGQIDIKHDPKWQPRKAGQGRTEEIIRTRQPIFLPTRAESAAWYNAKLGRQEYVGAPLPSWIGVPMVVGNKVFGVIATYHPEKEYIYSGDDLEILQSMANQAAIALDSARLFDNLQKRIQELGGLQEIGQVLRSEDDLKKLLKKIVEISAQVFDADIATIYQYDSNTEEFYLPVAFGVDEQQSMPSRDGVVAKIVREKEIILADNAPEATQFQESSFVKSAGIKSCAAVPLQYGGVPIGVLFINYLKETHYFTDSEQIAIRIFADQAATAINMAGNLYDSNQQLETVQNIINAVELHATLPAFLQNILEGVLKRVNAASGTIQLYDQKRKGLVIRAKIGNISNQQYEYIPLGTGITGKAAEQKHPIYASDTHDFPNYINYISDTRSEFVVPMLIGDVLVGVLNVEDPKTNAFSPYSRQLITRLGYQLAILVRQKMIAEEADEKRLTYRVNESMGLVTAEVTHKVGNAAGKIRILARERFKEATNLTDAQHRDVEIILRNVDEMITATSDLFKPFGAEPKVDITITEMLRVAIGQCVIPESIKLNEVIAPELPKVKVQVTKVQSYLAELLNNAVKYAKKGLIEKNRQSDTIEIVAQQSNDGFVEISLTNYGPSIPPDRWESIFKAFSARAQKSIDDDLTYGLGLWGARTAMQEQGGNVLLAESNDMRTVFVVRLPIV